MAVTIPTSGSFVLYGGYGTNLSMSLTANTGNYLLAIASWNRDEYIADVTWDGVSMTPYVYYPEPTSQWRSIGVWGLRNFNKGTKTFAVSSGSMAGGNVRWYLGCFSGVQGVRNVSVVGEAGWGLGSGFGHINIATTPGDYTFSYIAAVDEETSASSNRLYPTGSDNLYLYDGWYGSQMSCRYKVASSSLEAMVHTFLYPNDSGCTYVSFSLKPLVPSLMIWDSS